MLSQTALQRWFQGGNHREVTLHEVEENNSSTNFLKEESSWDECSF